MMKTRHIGLFALAVFLGGCATPVTQVNFVPAGITRASAPVDMELKTVTVVIAEPAVQTGQVRINATIPPLWKDAIQTAVDEAGLFKDDASRKVTISALIRKFNFNPMGFSNSCDVEVVYSVVDRSNGKIIFSRDITTTSSSNAGENWVAAVRLVNLWNRCAQESIRQFIEALKQSGLK